MRVPRHCRFTVAGLDLSLTSPAAVVIPTGWRLGDWKSLPRLTFSPRPDGGTLAGKYGRLAEIAGKVRDFVIAHSAPHVFVEDYAFSARSSSVTKLAELGGVVRCELFGYGRVAQPVTASQVRKLLLGKLPPRDQKKATHAALEAAGAGFENGDVADAFAVANFGLSELGCVALTLA